MLDLLYAGDPKKSGSASLGVDQHVSGFWIGTVVDNKDPEELYRLRVRVHPLYNDIQEDGLPWAWSGNIIGGFGQVAMGGFLPPVGSIVWVGFVHGDYEHPIWFGGQFGKPDGTNDIPTEAQAGYPNNHVIKTPGGIVIEYDDTEDAKRVRVAHPSGTEWLMTNEGNLEMIVEGDFKLTVKGNLEESVEGNVDKTIEGNRSVVTTGTDERESQATITDKAPIINHD